MKGQVLVYDDIAGKGQISGNDGKRYDFERAALNQLTPIGPGTLVDFDFDERRAFDIYVLSESDGLPTGPYSGAVEPERGLFEYFTRAYTANYANFQGRARRKEYWGFYLFYILIMIVLGAFVGAGAAMQEGQGEGAGTVLMVIGGIVLAIFVIASILPSLALLVRRFHDIGQSGWIAVLLLVLTVIPYLGFIASLILLVMTVLNSQPRVNKYGVPPKRV